VKKVAILTTFYEVESGYSLVSVVENQIRMMLDNGYSPIVLVDERFEIPKGGIWRPEIIDLREVVPASEDSQFENKLHYALQDNLEEVDVCLAHDIIYQHYYKKHDKILREYVETRDDLLWLHWIHSRPTRDYDTPPGYIIYPNDSDKAQVIRHYQLAGQEHRVIVNRASHSIDPLEIWPYDQLTKDLVRKSDLLGGDITAIYPRGGDKAKQTEKIIYLMAGVKKAGYEPRLLVVDWQSQGDKFQQYMDRMQKLSSELELENEVFFTSRLDDRCAQGVPRKNVMELFNLTNVYIHSSNAETYGLVPHEAMLRGNLVCLNHDWPAMRENFGNNAIYFDFGSVVTSRKYKPDEATFWEDEAKRLIAELRNNRALWGKTVAQRKWTPRTMWKDFERLLYLDDN
jgi:hypothetical protein